MNPSCFARFKAIFRPSEYVVHILHDLKPFSLLYMVLFVVFCNYLVKNDKFYHAKLIIFFKRNQ